METTTYISPNQILANVLPMLDDVRMEDASKGFYVSTIQRAIETIAFDSFFDERLEDFAFPKDDLFMPIPENMINLISVYVFNGDKCNIKNSHKVWFKRNYITRGEGMFAYDKADGTHDPFYQPRGHCSRFEDLTTVRRGPADRNLLWYNIQSGKIMFSPGCRGYEKVALIFNGTGCAIGDLPIIPLQFRTFVEDYVCEFILRIKMAKDPAKWRNLWGVYDMRLNKPYDGSLDKAIKYTRQLTQAQRNDFHTYLGNPGF